MLSPRHHDHRPWHHHHHHIAIDCSDEPPRAGKIAVYSGPDDSHTHTPPLFFVWAARQHPTGHAATVAVPVALLRYVGRYGLPCCRRCRRTRTRTRTVDACHQRHNNTSRCRCRARFACVAKRRRRRRVFRVPSLRWRPGGVCVRRLHLLPQVSNLAHPCPLSLVFEASHDRALGPTGSHDDVALVLAPVIARRTS